MQCLVKRMVWFLSFGMQIHTEVVSPGVRWKYPRETRQKIKWCSPEAACDGTHDFVSGNINFVRTCIAAPRLGKVLT